MARTKGPEKRRVLISIRESAAQAIEVLAHPRNLKLPTFIAEAVETKYGKPETKSVSEPPSSSRAEKCNHPIGRGVDGNCMACGERVK